MSKLVHNGKLWYSSSYVDNLENELRSLKSKYEFLGKPADESELAVAVIQLRIALEKYADRKNWKYDVNSNGFVIFSHDDSDSEHEGEFSYCGKRARAALKGVFW